MLVFASTGVVIGVCTSVCFFEHGVATVFDPGTQCVRGGTPKGDDALLVSLTRDFDGAAVHVEICKVERDELGNSHAGGIQQFEDRRIALAKWV